MDVHILGGGPAGASAAIAARLQGAGVTLFEKSRFPRHKVCGEFLSPEILPLLEALGVARRFNDSGPAVIRRMALHFEKREKRCNLPEAAYGLSRYSFDHLLLDEAVRMGTSVVRDGAPGTPLVLAAGRKSTASRGKRLFGFKAHYQGPANDAVELFFFQGCYVGVNPVEGGATNVCGIAPEEFLRERGFDMDAVVRTPEALAERLRPLTRMIDWLTVGPVEMRQKFERGDAPGVYPAGDALSFVDPFTGSGLLNGVTTGRMAGMAAASGKPVDVYLKECRKCLKRPFEVSSLLRTAVENGWAEHLAGVIPGSWLYWLTRPRIA